MVGGLMKLISAFVRALARNGRETGWGVDAMMLIKHNFGCGDALPNSVGVEAMDPATMIVSNIDGVRQPTGVAGLTPLEQPQRQRWRMTRDKKDDNDDDDDNNNDNVDHYHLKMISLPGVLRAGLLDSLLRELGEEWGDDCDNREMTHGGLLLCGFHLMFDVGVERLNLVVADDGGGVKDEDHNDGRTQISLSLVELWDASTPCYTKEHYSSNAGVQEMLQCIRSAQELGDD